MWVGRSLGGRRKPLHTTSPSAINGPRRTITHEMVVHGSSLLIPAKRRKVTDLTNGALDESRRSIVRSIHTMQDAHLVQHTVSFEDRPWLNDMDKKTPIEIAAEARRAASNNQARTPTHPVPVKRLVPTDRRRLQMPSSGTTAHPDAAFRKKRSRRTAPSTATIATTPTRTNIMHANLSKGVGPFEHRLATRVLPVWWRLGASAQSNTTCLTPCRLSTAEAGRPQASCPVRRPPRRPAAERCSH